MRIFIIIGLLAVAGCNDKPKPRPWPQPGPAVSMCPAWTVNPLVGGLTYGPTSCSDNGTAPIEACPASFSKANGLHTVVRPQSPLPYGGTITIDFEVTGGPFQGVESASDTSAAYLSLFMQRLGDNWSGQGEFNDYRRYSRKGVTLTPGRHTLAVQLTPDQWTSVITAGTDAGFNSLLPNVERIGYVVGTYQSGKAHGACSKNGPGQITIHGFSVS
jgi:hypothetical protein